ncbi:MAG: hypothetical protein WBF93_21680 [Pirellulales bacterium]
MKIVISSLSVAVALLTAAVLAGDAEEDPDPRTEDVASASEKEGEKSAESEGDTGPASVWMRIKMRASQGVLEGLAKSDFQMIYRNAEKMKRFGKIERWARIKNEEYQTQLRFFNQSNADLMRQAKQENLDGATLAFMQLTASCVHCHRTIREADLQIAKDREVTHVVTDKAAYYFDGPQQARPPDGKLAAGTEVAVINKAGSYWLVLSEHGDRVFVAADHLKEIDRAADDEDSGN